MGFSAKNTAELEAHLSKNATLTEGGQPGPTDAHIALQITGTPYLTQMFPMSRRPLTSIIGTSSSRLSLQKPSKCGPISMSPRKRRKMMTILIPLPMMMNNPPSQKPPLHPNLLSRRQNQLPSLSWCLMSRSMRLAMT